MSHITTFNIGNSQWRTIIYFIRS